MCFACFTLFLTDVPDTPYTTTQTFRPPSYNFMGK